MNHQVSIDESDRQAILLALAKLSLERPGWLDMLTRIACKMDNNANGKAEMLEQFRKIHVADVSVRARSVVDLANHVTRIFEGVDMFPTRRATQAVGEIILGGSTADGINAWNNNPCRYEII